jgi:tyrosine-protein kinase Etk/Wzc
MTNRIGNGGPGPRPNGARTGSAYSPGRRTTHLRELLNFVQRNRALVLGVPALVVAATLVFVFLVTPVYEASSWIRIDEERSNLPVIDALQTLSSGDQIHTEIAVLRRRPLAEQVVDSLGLQLVMTSPKRVPRNRVMTDVGASRAADAADIRLVREDAGFRIDADGPGGQGVARVGEPVTVAGVSFRLLPAALEHEELELEVLPFHKALDRFRRTAQVTRPDRDADLIRIRYESRDSVLVQTVPNTMARFFIRNRNDVRKTEARSTVDFLHQQIALLSDQLWTAEDALRTFRERENIVSLEREGEVKVGRFAELRAERDVLNAERQALAEMLAEARQRAEATEDPLAPSPYRDLIAFPTLFVNFSVSELFRSMAEVENQRAQLLNLRTPEDPDVVVLTSRIQELERQLRNIAVTYLEGLTQQVASFDETMGIFRRELAEVPAKEVQYARLFRQADLLSEIYTLLQTRLKEAEIAAAVEDPTMRVVEPAVVPVEPIRPNKPLSLVLSLLLGLGLGVGAAFLRENMDSSVHTREDLQEIAPDLPVLGLIPRIQEAATNGRRETPVHASKDVKDLSHRLIAGRDPRSPISEAYRSMRTNITFSSVDRPHRTLVFTSALPGDGKSTSSANLAVTLAQQGLGVLLVDADMRRGVLNEVLGELRAPGLSDVLVTDVELTAAIRRIDLGESGGLDFLPSGTLPPNPAELISSPRTRALLDRLMELYDTVILDAPPLNLVTDAALLGTYADGVVVVARSGVTDRGAIAYALEQLAAVRAPVLGVVLNDIDVRKDRFYGSYGLASYERYAADVDERVRT